MTYPQLTGRFLEDGSISDQQINAAASISYSKLNLLGAIQASDLDAGSLIPESQLSLDFDTHAENSPLSLQENYLAIYEKLANVSLVGSAVSLATELMGVPIGSSTVEGAIVSALRNKSLLLDSTTGKYASDGTDLVYGRLTDKKVVAQPVSITGTTVTYVSSEAVDADLDYFSGSTELSWDGGPTVDVSTDGSYKLIGTSGDFITVDVVTASLPPLSESDSLTLTTEYTLGIFSLDASGQEEPYAGLSGPYDVYYPHTKTLDSKPWDSLITIVNMLNIPKVLTHEHLLTEGATDVSATSAEINQAISGIGLTVTAPNLDTLTDTSNADALHTHASAIGAPTPLYFTAGVGQTNFDLSVVPAMQMVTIEGVLQRGTVDYNVVGTEVVLTSGAGGGETVGVHYWTA
jgi:hypothetical protein